MSASTYDMPFLASGGCIVLNSTAMFNPSDNSRNVISREVNEAWDRILRGVLLQVLFLISFPCNTLNTVIFFKHGIRERVNLCLFFLSLMDLLYMGQAFYSYADRLYLEATHQPLFGALLQFTTRNYLWGLYGFGWVSSWITTIIACERCFCVVSPLRAHTVLKTQTMWVIIMVPSIIIFGLYFVTNTKWGIECVFDPINNSTILDFYPSEFFLRNKELIDTLDGVLFGLLYPQFCVLTVTVATIITVVKLRSMTKWREKSSVVAGALSSREVALTKMLVGTSVLFIISFIPRSVLRIVMLFINDLSMGGRYYNMYNLLIEIATFFVFLNSSFNFPIYYIYGSKFRATLKTMFRYKDVQAKNTADSGTTGTTRTASQAELS